MRNFQDGSNTGGRGESQPAVHASALAPTDVRIPAQVSAPGCFADLNLDQVLAAVTAGREEYDLLPFFHTPARDIETVAYRHEIMRDLEQDEVLTLVKAFSASMRAMRDQMTKLGKLYYRLQKEAVFLDAIDFYCRAIERLGRDLGIASLRSRGLLGFRRHVGDYLASHAFARLRDTREAIREDLAGIEYSLLMDYGSVTVRKLGDEPDYSAAVAETFARFKQGEAADFDFKLTDFFEMNHVEAGILDRVALLYPEIFARLDRYFAEHQDYLEPVIGRWDRELQFYVAWLDYVAPLQRAGLRLCYPTLSPSSKAERAGEAFDIALARKLVGEKMPVITNGFELAGRERAFVISGPNQGGKTTFARMFGQMHYLAKLGCTVPGKEASLFFFDDLYTHFEREEDIRNHRGKLEDDLVRIHAILRRATPQSIVILNEIFTSTTLGDALFLGKRVVERLLELDLIFVCVTFMDELSALGPQTVSLVSTVVPENPAERTFRVIRRPADGRSYAMSIAEKYRVTYEDSRA